MPERSGSEFLNIKYPDLQKSDQVQKSVEKKQRFEGAKTPNQPKDRNEVFLDRLENIFDNQSKDTKDRNIELFKNKFLYSSILVDQDNLPDSYFELQQKIAKERGYGDIHITNETKKEMSKTVYDDQKKSLNTWIDYLSSKDADYPTWFKYYTLRSVLKMGNYNKEKKEFSKRTKTTTNIFPDLNREALAYSYDTLSKYYLKNEKHNNEELNRILESANFSKIYAFAIDKVTPISKENKEKTEGEWLKYNQGDDPTALYESLQGHGTGWCTAGEETARRQLKNGDFYVYYTKDENNQNTIPRIAIRMENRQVAEVRGVDSNQNLEDEMIDIAQKKYHQLPGGEKFDKKDHDMRLLTLIDEKTKSNLDLTKDEILFLYEVNEKIQGFGWALDPRVKELKSKRNSLPDYKIIFQDNKFFNGDVFLNHIDSAPGLNFPEHFIGNIILSSLTSAEGIEFPEHMEGNIILNNLTSTEGIEFPKHMDGSIYLEKLISANKINFPEQMKGSLYLQKITSAQGLKFPDFLDGSINLQGLTSPQGLKLPKIAGEIYLNSLTSANNVIFPRSASSLYLYSLESAEGVKLPKTVWGLHLENITSAKGLKLPKNLYHLYLNNLESLDGLKLPKKISSVKINDPKLVLELAQKYPKIEVRSKK